MSTIVYYIQKAHCKKMAFFNMHKLLSKNMQYFLYKWSNIQYINWRRKLFKLDFSEFSETKRDPATLQLWHYYTHKICEQLQRQQLMKWSDGALSEKCLTKKFRLIWGYLDRCNGVEYFKREEWHSVSTQNGKDHKQILTSQGKYPGSNTTQEAVTVKVETGSVSVTA